MAVYPVILIATLDAKYASSEEPNIEAHIRKALRATKDHYLLTDEIDQIKAACAGAIMSTDVSVEKELIIASFKQIVNLNSAFATAKISLPLNFGVVEGEEQRKDLLPIRQLWDEIQVKP